MANKRITKKLKTNKGTTLNFGGINKGYNLIGNNLNDILVGGNLANSIVGGNGNNSLVGGAGNDTIKSGSGNDTILGNGGADSIIAGGGNDDIVFATSANLAAAVRVDGGSGVDEIFLTTNSQTVTDANFANVANVDSLYFANGDNSVELGANAATAGLNTVTGGTGVDAFTQTVARAMTLDGGAGNDSFTFSTAAIMAGDSVVGGLGTNSITLTTDGQAVTDASFANVDNVQSLTLANGANSVILDTNADATGIASVFGGSGADSISQLAGYNNAATLVGGFGDDTFAFNNVAQLDGSFIDGGMGANVISFAPATAAVELTDANFANIQGNTIRKIQGGDASTIKVTLGSNALAAGIQSVIGGLNSDTLTSNITDRLLDGGAGNDSLNSNAANTSLVGGSGNDTLNLGISFTGSVAGGDGNDYIIINGNQNSLPFIGSAIQGGNNNDTLTFTSSVILDGSVNWTNIDLGDGNNEILLQAAGNTIVLGSIADGSNIDQVVGTQGSDTFDASGLGNAVTLVAAGNNNSLVGSAFSDSLVGSGNNDTFIGNAGDDTIVVGGTGAEAFGGTGNDEFVFDSNSDLASAGNVDGGADINTIRITTAGDILDTDFTSSANIDNLVLANGTNNVDLAFEADEAGIASVRGGTGNDNVDASAIAYNLDLTFNASLGGADTFVGGTGNDDVIISHQQLTGSNIDLDGGAGVNTLTLSTGGNIDDADFNADIANFDVLALTGANEVTFNSDANNAGFTTIYGGAGNSNYDFGSGFTNNVTLTGGAGNDDVDAANIGGDITFFAGANDTFVGGSQNNNVVFTSNADLASANIEGGAGATTVTVNDTANDSTIADSSFANKANIDTLALAGNANYDLTLNSDANSALSSSGNLDITTGNGDNTITVVSGFGNTNNLDITFGTGNDEVTIATAAQLANSDIAGGTGTDTLSLTQATTYADSAFNGDSGIEVLELTGINDVTFNGDANAAGFASIYGGVGDSNYDFETAFSNSVTLVGGAGNDDVNAANIGGDITFLAGANDTFVGGLQNNVVVFGSNEDLASSNIDGMGGETTITISSADTIVDADFADVANLDSIALSGNGNYTLTLNSDANNAIDASTGNLDITTGNGENIITVESGFGDTNNLDITFGTGNDEVTIATAAQLANSDIAGGNGDDTLTLAEAGTYADSAFNGESSIEVLELELTGINDVTFNGDANAAGFASIYGGAGDSNYDFETAFTNNVTLVGGSGFDDVNAANIGGDITFLAGANDTFVGGLQNNVVVFGSNEDLASSNIDGMGGETTITISSADTIVDADFADVANLDSIALSGNGNYTLTLNSDANNAIDASTGNLDITTGNGDNTITVVSGFGNTNNLDITFGTGNDEVTIATAAQLANSDIAGGTGTDTLSLTQATTYADTAFADVSNIEVLVLGDGSNIVTLGANADAAGFEFVYGGTGNDDIDASAFNSDLTLQAWSGVAVNNANNDTLTGGSGNDVFVLGDTTNNAYGRGGATNYTAYLSDFDISEDSITLSKLAQTGAVTVTQSNTVANQMDIKVGGTLVYTYNYNNGAQTADMYVAGTTNLVATFDNVTGNGASLSTTNFTLLG